MRFEPNDDDLRREQDYERLGTRTPKCRMCDETDPRALTGTAPDILCYEHDRERHGLPSIEDQHAEGAANTRGTYPTRGNDHRVWDEAKVGWPERTLTNPARSPLLAGSAAIRTVLDWFRAIIERVLGWVPTFLEELDAKLEEVLGTGWWCELGFGEAR